MKSLPRTSTDTRNAEPVPVWQSVQWQIETFAGSASPSTLIAPQAQLLVAEIAAGAINVEETVAVTRTQTRLRTYAPRLSAEPLEAVLAIENAGDGALLVLDLDRARTVVLESPLPLRFAPATGRQALEVQVQTAGAWLPIIVAPLHVNAALVCRFDMISRTCR